MRRTLTGAMIALLGIVPHAQSERSRGVTLANLTWVEAERVLDASALVMLPLGVALEQHGPHLKLNNDERLARYLQARVEAAASVVIAPPLTYHYNPAFVEYPGSATVPLATARDMTVGIVRSLSAYGPRRFYVLNTSTSARRALEAAAGQLANEGILLQYTDLDARLGPAIRQVQQQQPPGTHADEIETSMMLFIDPASVDMTKAVREFYPGSPGRFTRVRGNQNLYSSTGVHGDPTFASADKGRLLVDTLVRGILDDIDKLRVAPLPLTRSAPAPGSGSLGGPASSTEPPAPNGCTPSVERVIREIGARFSIYWRQMDAEAISLLFTDMGDIRHPDGTIERGPAIIKENRRELFSRREYRGSVHPLTLNDIRCVGTVAIADGKWELRLTPTPATGNGAEPQRTYNGWCTLVFSGSGRTWGIEAWRYTVDPPNGAPPPTTLKQPGFLRKQ